jgi:cation transport ATPase
MANAILRPDYATGVGLSGPLRVLSLNRIAMKHGALVRSRNTCDQLASCVWVLLDDHEMLDECECELAEYRIRGLPEEQLFRALAGAGAWLGDPRGPALMRACAERGQVGRHTTLHDIDETGVAITYGPHMVRLRGRRPVDVLAPLRVEVDGVEVAALSFRHGARPIAAATVHRLQRAGLRVFLASDRSLEDAGRVARQLGADSFAGGLDDRARCDLLRLLHERDVAVVHVRDGAALPHMRDNYVSVALAGPDGIRYDADVALITRSFDALPSLIELARERMAHVRQDHWTVIVPNLVAIGGVFSFGLGGLAVVLISNLGTYIVHERARRALLETKNNPAVETAADDLDEADFGSLPIGVSGPEHVRV